MSLDTKTSRSLYRDTRDKRDHEYGYHVQRVISNICYLFKALDLLVWIRVHKCAVIMGFDACDWIGMIGGLGNRRYWIVSMFMGILIFSNTTLNLLWVCDNSGIRPSCAMFLQ